MKIIFIAVVLTLVWSLSGFTTSAQTEGWWTQPFTFTTHKKSMSVTWVSDPETVRKAIEQYDKQNPGEGTTLAFAKWKGNRCTIYAYEPKMEGDENMVTLGHEMLHCFRGDYHE